MKMIDVLFLKKFKWLYHHLASKQLTLILFPVLCLILIPGTLEDTEYYSLGVAGSVVFGFIILNLMLCTLQRIKTLARSVIVIHVGILLVFAGALISSSGYVATVNIHEGTSVNEAYRWDLEKNIPLGVDLEVKKIHVKYYPIPVKVGVLRGEEKVGLFVLKTGEVFQLGGYNIKADSIEFPSKTLKLSVFEGDEYIGAAETSGTNDLQPDFPYDFRLVAYQNPNLMRLWVDLVILKDSQIVAEGTSEVNKPLSWGKLSFHNTQADADKYGMPYAGIQITNDPGVPYVYTGFIVLGIGSLMYMYRRLYGRR